LKHSKIDFKKVKAVIFDFDGVFTDNTVFVSSDGAEALRFSKLDSLGIDLFREFTQSHNLNLDLVVITKEKSEIVAIRAKKLGLRVVQGVQNKWTYISQELLLKPNEFIYFGNDLNDLESMQNSLMSFAPVDAHHKIKEVATRVLQQQGGGGFVREGLELLMEIEFMEKGRTK
jgi:N-acylneuraminate cytidylyltransferase